MRFSTKLLLFLGLLLISSGAHAACRPLMFGECCGREPCSFITWRGDCKVLTYQLYADFLYWQIYGEGLEFARDGGSSGAPGTPVDETGTILSPGCRAKPGFRIGLTVDLPCCTWDAFGRYTYISNNLLGSKRVANGVTGLNPLIWNHGVNGTEDINYAEGKWGFEVSVFDFGLGHNFPIGGCFNFRPHLGLKTTWQKHHYRVTYENIVNTATITRDQICFVTDFNGVGLRGGFDAEWRLCRCLSFVGGISTSALYSDLNQNRRDDHTDNILSNNPISVTNVWLKDEHCVLLPVTELLIGLQWVAKMFTGYEYSILVAWETQKWWNLNQFLFISNDTVNNNFEFGPQGGVTYQGLTVRLKLDF
ncbi:MAG: hypothetical protein K940chlam3_01163 [Chlamydiae bacterium]|nr:hypothetical protein [Chlamydiota bacterium]